MSAPPVGIWACHCCRGGWRRACSARSPHAGEHPNRAGRKGGPIEEVVPEWRAVRDLGRRTGTNCQDFVRVSPVKRKFSLEYLGVRVGFHTLANGGSRAVHACPTTHGDLGVRRSASARAEFRRLTRETVRAWCFANNIVHVLLSVSSEVATGGRGSDSGVPLLRCVRKPPEGDVEAYPREPRWAPNPSPR